MNTARLNLRQHSNALLLDFGLLAAIYLLPSLSHLLALPLYQLEPMRLALIVALLFSHRANAYLVAITLPLASAWITGHPEPLKAALMAIEFGVLISAYGWLKRDRKAPAFLALAGGIVLGKLVYYGLKSAALAAGWLSGSLVTTPWTAQLILAAATAAVFGFIEARRKASSHANAPGSDTGTGGVRQPGR